MSSGSTMHKDSIHHQEGLHGTLEEAARARRPGRADRRCTIRPEG